MGGDYPIGSVIIQKTSDGLKVDPYFRVVDEETALEIMGEARPGSVETLAQWINGWRDNGVEVILLHNPGGSDVIYTLHPDDTSYVIVDPKEEDRVIRGEVLSLNERLMKLLLSSNGVRGEVLSLNKRLEQLLSLKGASSGW